MTSTTFDLSSARPLSCKLPIEIWDNIIQEVQAIEARAVMEDIRAAKKTGTQLGYSDVYCDNKFVGHEVSKWRRCIRTTRSLILVCRLWRDIFTPFLYSSLHITRRGECRALSSHQIAKILRRRPSYGHYIRRLEVWSTESTKECAYVISICNRLQILGLPQGFDWTEVAQFVSGFPVIKHLSIRYSQPVIPEPCAAVEPFPAIITLPHLQTLQISGWSDRLVYSPACSLPSLRILKLDILGARSYSILSLVASTLQEIEIGSSSKYSLLAGVVPVPFPRLRTITITFQSGSVSWLPSIFPPPLPALRTLCISGSSRDLFRIVKGALDIKSKYGLQWAPKLDVIRALLYSCDHPGRCTGQCIDTSLGIDWLACQDRARGLNVRLEIDRLDEM
jgi:hypothetical protein